MDWGNAAELARVVDIVLRETMLFAGALFVVFGIDDLLVDAIFLFGRLRRRDDPTLACLGEPARHGPFAIFVPAWREERVIAAMLEAALSRYDHADYRVFVGCYPNDPATIAAVAGVAATDPRVRLVIGDRDGPTTKADCLNTLWRALLRDEDGAGREVRAVVIHDAEDVVHPAELRLFDHFLGDHALVQIPVVPLIDRSARFVSGHYADEFAESHGKTLPVRSGIGAALPLAGVGCAIRRDALASLADATGPFDAASLTEDYELGLRVAELGLRGRFVRMRTIPGGELIATRAFFPRTVRAAVVQKSRWVTGIALAGWDRVGWGRTLRPIETWMRMRDRRALLAVLALVAAYVALLAWAVSIALHYALGTAPPAPRGVLRVLLGINVAFLVWRLAFRARTTAATYGWREGLWALPRSVVANVIAMLAARRAVTGYVASLAGRALRWDKTDHVFPATLPGGS